MSRTSPTASEGFIGKGRTPAKGSGPSAQGDPSSSRAAGPESGPAIVATPSLAASAAPLPEDDKQSHAAAPLPASVGDGAFGTLLEPMLRKICDDRLSAITWFRTEWQRGGALTGYAVFRDDADREQPVVIKMPVPPCERHWLVQLTPHDDVGPHVYAHGDMIGGYDLAWVVMERLPHGPLNSDWGGAEFDLLVDAVGRFYRAAADHAPVGEPVQRDWEHVLDVARQKVRQNTLPEQPRWTKALKKAQRKLKPWTERWLDRPIHHWRHGDLHLGNAMTRTEAPGGPAVLFDFANTRVGHWVEDAVYFEHIYWSRPQRLEGRKLCKAIARRRKELGLEVESDWAELAEVKRALLAMSTPTKLEHFGDPVHVIAALDVLERAVG